MNTGKKDRYFKYNVVIHNNSKRGGRMPIFCEIVVAHALPAIRSALAMELVKGRGATQMYACELMGITQPAISQYLKGKRGRSMAKISSNKKVTGAIKALAGKLIRSKNPQKDLNDGICGICKIMRKQKMLDDTRFPYQYCVK